MVKFSKELEAQLIPEWKEAFVNYWKLKKCVKKIKLSSLLDLHKQPPPSSSSSPPPLHPHKHHPYYYCAAFMLLPPLCRCLRHIATLFRFRFRHTYDDDDITPNIIQVRKKTTKVDNGGESNSVEEEEEEEEVYETQLLNLFSEQDEVKVFFEWVDEELNKVNQFYKKKETELIERGEALKKQLQILMDLNHLLLHRRRTTTAPAPAPSSSPRITSGNNGEDSSSHVGGEMMSEIQSEIMSSSSTSENVGGGNNGGLNQRPSIKTKNNNRKKKKRMDYYCGAALSLTATDHKITTFTSKLWDDIIANHNTTSHITTTDDTLMLLQTRKKRLHSAEKMIRGAFVDLYRGLNLLNNYSSLNMIAFIKILKKFDKVANQKTSLNYLKVVKGSHFVTSDMVVRMKDEVESVFTRHFASNDRKKAMKFLRPTQHNDSHTVTFFVGLFTGSFVTMFTAYAILAHLAGIFSSTSDTHLSYVEIVYPVFSIFALVSLHIFMYGCNLFMWKRTRINYSFIFDFCSPNTALNYRDAFLVSTTLMATVVTAMLLHLLVRPPNASSTKTDAIPGLLLLAFFVLLIFPLNIFYRPTRFCFIRIIRKIVSSPFCKVVMVDFFMADQLTSQIPALRYLESTTCYYIAGYFRTHQYQVCKSGKLYRRLAYLISFSPYYWRAMQCGRRWFDEGNADQLANMGKYVSAMVAAGARLTYATESNQLWFWIALITSVAATMYQLYWDFVKDWGLLNPKSTNPWLRDDLILKQNTIYYISIVVNIVLRVAWVETVMQLRMGEVESRMLDFVLASLEVIRRGHWNFYRLENEHLNNVGKFRAVKMVPLPFHDS